MKKSKKNNAGRVLSSVVAAVLMLTLAVPTALSSICTITEPIEAEAADVDIPEPIMDLNFEKGFIGEKTKNGLTVLEEGPRLMFEEVTDDAENYIKDENGEYIFEWTDKPVIDGDTVKTYHYGVVGNQPTTYDDPQKGNVFELNDSWEIPEFVKKEEDDVKEVPVYTAGYDEDGNPLDADAYKASLLQEGFTAQSGAQINNPFVGMDFTEEYDNTTEDGPQWTKGVTIAYWVKAPQPREATEEDTEDTILNDSVLFTFENIARDPDVDQMTLDPNGEGVTYEVNGWIKHQACVNFNADDPLYALGKRETVVDRADTNPDTNQYIVASEYGPLVRLNPEYEGTSTQKIYFREDDSERVADKTIKLLEGGKLTDVKLYELGANIYNDYITLDTEEGSLVGRGYINGSMQISSSNSFFFKEDDYRTETEYDESGNPVVKITGGPYDLNPHNSEYGTYRQFRYYNTYYYRGDESITSTPDVWHYVVCVIQNDWTQFYVDGEEIEADSLRYCDKDTALSKLNGKKYFNKGFGIRYPYHIGWANVADWVANGTFSSGPSNCVPQTMLEWLSDPDTVLYIGNQGCCAKEMDQDMGTVDGTMIDDITFYNVPLTAEQAVMLTEEKQADFEAAQQADEAPAPIKVFNFDSDARLSVPAGMTVAPSNEGTKVEDPAVANTSYGHTLMLNMSRAAETSAVSFENPFKGMDLEGATVSYWIKESPTDKGVYSDGVVLSFIDEPKILEHSKIQEAVKEIKTRTGLYTMTSNDAMFQAGLDTQVYDSLKNSYKQSTKKNGYTDKAEAYFEQDAYDLEQEWNERLKSLANWHYVVMVLKNSGITMYFDGEKQANNQEDLMGPTFYGPRFYDGYYHRIHDNFAALKFGTGNQMATPLLTFLTQEDTSGYFGLMYKLGSSATYMNSAETFIDDVSFYDKALSDAEVATIYAAAQADATSKAPVAGEELDDTATGEKDPVIDENSKEEEGTFKDGTATAAGVTVKGDAAELDGATLKVTVLGTKDAAADYTAADTALKGASIDTSTQVVTLYKIEIVKEGVAYTPKTAVNISMTPPSGYDASKTSIVRMSDVKSMTVTVSAGKLVYDTESLGQFAIMQKKATPVNSSDGTVSGNASTSGSATAGKTGDAVSVAVPLVLLATAFVVIVLLRKKEEITED